MRRLLAAQNSSASLMMLASFIGLTDIHDDRNDSNIPAVRSLMVSSSCCWWESVWGGRSLGVWWYAVLGLELQQVEWFETHAHFVEEPEKSELELFLLDGDDNIIAQVVCALRPPSLD
eukprot:632007-Amphidinium_carterae.1